MPSVFLIQLAAGSLLSVALSRVHLMAWRYLRLMGVVCFGLLVLAALVLLRGEAWRFDRVPTVAGLALGGAVVLTIAWLVVNAVQGGRVGAAQRAWPALAGLTALVAAVGLTLRTDPQVAPIVAGVAGTWAGPATTAVTIALGAGLLGSVLAAMLLGHRYLTDTGMTIAPLRGLTRVFVAAVVLRALWVGLASRPIWADRNFFANLETDATWMWLLLGIRVGVGIVMTGVFAYMAWDCVRLRSTQSATGILFFTMIFVFLGELTGQYLLRSAGLAV